MDIALDQQVRSRALGRCEYCHTPQSDSVIKFHIDHITARQHGGATVAENLALCCGRCNAHKGPNIASMDPLIAVLTRLFNPRIDVWSEHFVMEGPVIRGLTPIGRATVNVLNMNTPLDIAARQAILKRGYSFQ